MSGMDHSADAVSALCYKGVVKQVLRFPLLLLFALVIHFSAFADGKVFSQAVAVPAKTPDQRAMLHFDKGTERLVIETSFVGEGTNFAWVVPFPSEPKIEPVSEDFFSILNESFQPKLIYQPTKLWIFCLFIGAILSLALLVHRSKGPQKWFVWLLFVVVVAGLFILSLPNFVKARGLGSSTTADVTVLQRQVVGLYDTVVLRSKDGGAVVNWLNTHQFATPTKALSTISRYASEGWVFAAATLHRTNSASTQNRPHPLCFTFETEKAVYPLRLTGIENDDCSIELFVFGSDRAEAESFKVQYCGRPYFDEDREGDWVAQMGFSTSGPGQYKISEAEILEKVKPSSVTTKLIGTLSPQQMESDAYLRWVPFEPALPVLYSYDAAIDLALSWFVFIGVCGGLLVQGLAPRLRPSTVLSSLATIAVIAAVGGLIQYLLLPKTEVRTVRNFYAAINNLRQLDGAIDQMLIERGTNVPVTFAEFKLAIDPYVKGGVKNPFTYGPLEEGKTAGNFTLRTNLSSYDVIWYDINARPHRFASFPKLK